MEDERMNVFVHCCSSSWNKIFLTCILCRQANVTDDAFTIRAKLRKTKSLQLYEYFYEHFDINSNRILFLLLLQFVLVQMLWKCFFESKCLANSVKCSCQWWGSDLRPHKSVWFKKDCEIPTVGSHMFNMRVARSFASPSGERAGSMFTAQKIYTAQYVHTRTCGKRTSLWESSGLTQVTWGLRGADVKQRWNTYMRALS